MLNKTKITTLIIFSTLNIINSGYTKDTNKASSYQLNKEDIAESGSILVGDLLLLMEYKLPVAPQSKQHKNILKKIKRTNNEIIELTDDIIVVQVVGKDVKTEEPVNLMLVKYLFKNKLLVKGPLLEKQFTGEYKYQGKFNLKNQ